MAIMKVMSKFCYQAVPEETIFIDLPGTDGLKIKGILRGSLTQPLVVMMHGLPGEGNELLQYLGARYLYEQGFASLRLFLYDSEPKTRDLVDCTLETHAHDLEAVVDYLRHKKVPTIFAEGHSYGGIAILRASCKLDGAVLWDPTHGLAFHDPEVAKFYKEARLQNTNKLKLYLDGQGYIEPKAITQEQINMGDTTAWAANKKYPLKIVSAGKGIMVELGRRYIEVADEPRQQVIIEEANHPFQDSDEVIMKLFAETAEWFKEILHV